MVKKLKNCLRVDFDSSKETSWCTKYNRTNLSSLLIYASEKLIKSGKNRPFWQNCLFCGTFSWFFFKNGSLQRAEVCCVAFNIEFSVPRRFFFLLSYQNQWSEKFRFWTLRGEPYHRALEGGVWRTILFYSYNPHVSYHFGNHGTQGGDICTLKPIWTSCQSPDPP